MATRERADVRTLAEVRDGINALTPAEWGRLRFAAARYSFGGAIEPDDLLQEAIKRSLEKDGRKWPLHVSLIKFLAEAMRSIADGEREKPENRMTKVPIGTEPSEEKEEGGDFVDPPDPSASIEQQLGERQEDAAMRASLLLLFIDDSIAMEIIEGIWAGMNAEELRALTGLNKTEYESKRKLMHRRIMKRYPNGWAL